ncbi:hypothetical protein OIU78_019191, partial [Salix suchowensis]
MACSIMKEKSSFCLFQHVRNPMFPFASPFECLRKNLSSSNANKLF